MVALEDIITLDDRAIQKVLREMTMRIWLA